MRFFRALPAVLVVSGTLLAVPAPSGAREAAGLPFIEDDYGRALAEAKSRDVPIFVEAWAPW
ncbi:MAG: hypothetical protein LC796_14705 [Acidobacteria bacterium]|nr:hypothetical protein [Acidobacteriota bacterium]MCA1609551.1 hypothetical protein [Acidobacteriota bacterium]